MKSRALVLAFAALSLAIIGGTLAPAARAVDPYVVDIQECDRNNGQTTVPSGVPISVQNFAFVTGTYGLMRDFLLKQVTSKGVLRDGALTIVDVTDEWSEPQQIGSGPARGWVTRLPNTELAPLTTGEIRPSRKPDRVQRSDSDRVRARRADRLRPVPRRCWRPAFPRVPDHGCVDRHGVTD